MDTVQFTPEVIAGIVAVLLALVFAYFPKLRTAYGGLDSNYKSLIMIGLLLVTTLTIWLLSFYRVIVTQVPVTWWDAVKIFASALIFNQPTYKILPEAGDVSQAKLVRDTPG